MSLLAILGSSLATKPIPVLHLCHLSSAPLNSTEEQIDLDAEEKRQEETRGVEAEKVACVIHYKGVSDVTWSWLHCVYTILNLERIPDGLRGLKLLLMLAYLMSSLTSIFSSTSTLSP